jgi:hypothetical protein
VTGTSGPAHPRAPPVAAKPSAGCAGRRHTHPLLQQIRRGCGGGFCIDSTVAAVPGQLRLEEPSSGADPSTPRVDPAAPTVAFARVVGRRWRVCWLVGGSSLPSPAQGCGWVAARLTGRRPSTSDGWFPTCRVVHLRFYFFRCCNHYLRMLQSVFTDVAPCLPMLPQCSLNVGVHEVLMLQLFATDVGKVDQDVFNIAGCRRCVSKCCRCSFKMLQTLFLNVAYFFFMLHAT